MSLKDIYSVNKSITFEYLFEIYHTWKNHFCSRSFFPTNLLYHNKFFLRYRFSLTSVFSFEHCSLSEVVSKIERGFMCSLLPKTQFKYARFSKTDPPVSVERGSFPIIRHKFWQIHAKVNCRHNQNSKQRFNLCDFLWFAVEMRRSLKLILWKAFCKSLQAQGAWGQVLWKCQWWNASTCRTDRIFLWSLVLNLEYLSSFLFFCFYTIIIENNSLFVSFGVFTFFSAKTARKSSIVRFLK